MSDKVEVKNNAEWLQTQRGKRLSKVSNGAIRRTIQLLLNEYL